MVLEELIALLGFEVDGEENLKRFRDGIQRAEGRLKSFARRAAEVGRKVALGLAAIGTAALAAGTAMFKLAGDASKELDALAKAADRVGLTTDALQELRYAASQAAGVTSNTFDMAMQRFSRRVGEAANGSGALKDTIEELGISLRDSNGNMRNQDDILRDYGNAIANATSEQEALRLAFKAFDSEGATLVTMFRQGSEEVERLRAEFNQLGLAFSREEVERATKYGDQIDRLSGVLKAVRYAIGVEAMPFLMKWMDALEDWWKLNGKLVRQNIGDYMQSLGSVMDSLFTDILPRVRDGARGVDEAIRGMVSALSGGRINMADWSGLAGVMLLLLRRFSPLAFWATIFMLALEDIAKHMQGAESVTGRFVDAMTGAWEALKGFSPDFLRGYMESFEAYAGSIDLMTVALTGLAGVVFLGPALKIAAGLWAISAGLASLASSVGFGLIAKLGVAVWGISAVAREWTSLNEIWASSDGVLSKVDRSVASIVRRLTSDIGNLFGIDDLPGEIDQVEQSIQSKFGAMWGNFERAWDGLSETARTETATIGDAIVEALGLVDLFDAGRRIMQTLWDGFKSLADDIRAWFQTIIPGWAKDMLSGDPGGQSRQRSEELGGSIGRMAPPPPADGPRSRLSSPADDRIARAHDMPAPSTDNSLLASRLAEFAQKLDAVGGTQAMEQTVNQIAEDHRAYTSNVTMNNNTTINAPNANPQAIGSAVGSSVRNAGRDVGRSLAVTGNSGGAGR